MTTVDLIDRPEDLPAVDIVLQLGGDWTQADDYTVQIILRPDVEVLMTVGQLEALIADATPQLARLPKADVPMIQGGGA